MIIPHLETSFRIVIPPVFHCLHLALCFRNLPPISALLMVGASGQNHLGPVDLFQKQDPDQLVRKGHGSEIQTPIRQIKNISR